MRIEDEAWLRSQADRCCRLAQAMTDAQTSNTLKLMAVKYKQRADALAAIPRITIEPAMQRDERLERIKPPLEDGSPQV